MALVTRGLAVGIAWEDRGAEAVAEGRPPTEANIGALEALLDPESSFGDALVPLAEEAGRIGEAGDTSGADWLVPVDRGFPADPGWSPESGSAVDLTWKRPPGSAAAVRTA